MSRQTIDITPNELTMVLDVLKTALPTDSKVWVFGSRAKHTTRHNSDLDLAIDTGKPLDSKTRMALQTGFEDAHLPYTVDTVDMQTVEPYFKEIIDQQKKPLPGWGNVPELRFPEFEGEWESKTLGDFMSFKNGINADKGQYGHGRKFINVLDIIADKPIYHDQIIGSVSVSDKEFEKNEVKYGDILFQRSSETREEAGQSNIYLDKYKTATFGGFVIRGRPIVEFNPMYFDSLLKISSSRKEITTKSGGSTRFNVGQESLSSVSIVVTTNLKEQQKIADFLSSVDAKLAKLGRKKTLLEDYKRGVMQQIFSQKIRFKQDDGSEFPEWVYTTLGAVASIHRGSGLSKEVLVDSGVHKCIHYGELFTKYNEYTDQTFSRTNSDEGFMCEYGDIVMPTSDVTPKGLATATAILEDRVKAGGDINIIRLFRQFDPKFISYYINAHPNKIIPLVSGTTVKHIYAKDIKNVALSHPSKKEQQKIADFLSSIDQKIDSVVKLIKQLEVFKKGLLQKLFV